MAGDTRLYGDSIAWFEVRDGWMHRDYLLEREQGMEEAGKCTGRGNEIG